MNRLFSLTLVTLVLAISASCVKANNKDENGGTPISDDKARTFITATSRWCYQDSDNDQIFNTSVFLPSGTGEYGQYNQNTHQFVFNDPVSWAVSGNTLTMILPKTYNPSVWQFTMSGSQDNDGTHLYLTNVSTSNTSVLAGCNL